MNKLNIHTRELFSSVNISIIFVIMLLASLYKLWLAAVIPTGVSMEHPHDGTLFYNLAVFLYHGEWLGPYNQYTLIKGVGLPAFMALCARIGADPQLVAQLLYILGCISFYRVLRLLKINQTIALFGFVLLLFNPVTLSRMWLGFARQILYMPFVVLLLCSFIAIIYCVVKRESLNKLLPWTLLCSISLTGALNTREEGIWIYATMIPVLIIVLFFSYRHKCFDYLLCLFIIFALPLSADHYIKTQNFKHYGVYLKNELKEENYSRAWDAMLALNTAPTDFNPDTKIINEEIHMTLETRDKMLKISPLSKEIIEQMLVKETGLYHHVHDKVNGTYGLWSIRDALESAGYYKTSQLAIDTYGKLADDLEAFCQQDDNNCNEVVISKVQWKEGHWDKLLPTVGFVLNFTTMFPDVFLLKKEELEYVPGSLDFKLSSSKFFSASPYFTNRDHPVEISKDFPLSVIDYHEQKKWRKLKSNQERYHHYFPYLLFASLVLLFVILFRSWREADKVFILATLSGAFFSICAINIAIALTAYTAVARPAAPATIAVIMFVPIIFGYAIQSFKRSKNE